jgi:hypothetical protein
MMLNHVIDLEPSLKIFKEDVFLLAVSGQVPVDKLLKRIEIFKKIDLKTFFDFSESLDNTHFQGNNLDVVHKNLLDVIASDSEVSLTEDKVEVKQTTKSV